MIGPRECQPILAGHFRDRGLDPPIPVINSESILSILIMLTGSDLVCTFPTLLRDETEPIWPIQRIPVVERFDPVSIAITHSAKSPLTPAGQRLQDCVQAVAAAFARNHGDNPGLSR